MEKRNGSTAPAFYAPGKVSSSMSAPTLPPSSKKVGTFVFADGYAYVLWQVIKPSWCTDYDVSVYAHTGPYGHDNAGLVIDQTQSNVTESARLITRNAGPTSLRIYGINGVADPAEPFLVWYQFIND